MAYRKKTKIKFTGSWGTCRLINWYDRQNVWAECDARIERKHERKKGKPQKCGEG